MAGPVRISILANGAQARREFAQTGAAGTSMGRKFSGVAGLLKGGLIAGSAAAVYGIAALGKSAIETEAKFSQAMNLIQAATDAPAREMGKLNDLAIKLGNDTAFSANDAADAMLELAKAGLTTKQIMGGGVAGTLTLAAAGGTELGTAATIASNAMNAFNLKGRDMAKVAAALAGGANASSASVESLGQGLSQVGPGATNAGLSLQETVAALSAFDAAGIKGSDAGTSLKTMLARLVPSTEAASNAMADLGLDFTKSNGEFVNITDVADQLQQKLGKLSAEERARALNTIFGSDATRAATVLFKEGASGLQEYIDATNDQNAAQDMAKARMKGTEGALERLSGAVETAKLQIGQGLAPAVVATADALGSGITALFEFGDAVKKAQTAPNGTGDTILNQITEGSRDFIGALDSIKDGAATGFGELGDSISDLLARHGPMIRQVTELIGDLGGKLARFAGSAAGQNIALGFDLLGESLEIVAANVKIAGNVFFGFSDAVLASSGIVVESVTDMVANVIDTFISLAEAASKIPGLGDQFDGVVESLKGYRDGLEGFGDDFQTETEKIRKDLAEQQYLWNLTDREAAQYKNVLLGLPDDVKTVINTPGAVKSFTDVKKLGRQYNLTADEVTTVIRSEGVNLSLQQMRQLIRRYDLTPKQVRTLFKTQGIEPSLKGLATLQKRYGLTPPQIKTLIEVSGVDTSVKAVRRLAGDLDKTNDKKTNPKVTADTGAAMTASQSLIERLGNIKSKTVVITTRYETVGNPPPAGGGGGGGGNGRLVDPAGRVAEDVLRSSSTASKIRQIMERLRDQVAKEKKHLKESAKNHKEYVKGLREIHQNFLKSLRGEIKDATSAYKDLQKASAAYAKSIKQSFADFGSITALGEGAGFADFDQLLGNLEGQVDQAKEFKDVIQQLRKAGLNRTTIQQLLAAGPASLGTAQALLSGGEGGIKDFNQLTNQLLGAGQSLGNDMADEFYKAGLKAARALVQGLKKYLKKGNGGGNGNREAGREAAREFGNGFDEERSRTRTRLRASDTYAATRAPTREVPMYAYITAEQLSDVEQGRRIKAKLVAFEGEGGRSRR